MIRNAKVLADGLKSKGCSLVTDGTDNHLLLVDLTKTHGGALTGKDAETWLDRAHITVNKNAVPNDPRSPFITSGFRVGTPAATTRGFAETEMERLAGWIARVLESGGDEENV